MSISAGDIDRAWKKLGMEFKNTNDRWATLKVDGKHILRTGRSFGSGKLEGNIPHFIRQQMKLNDEQFKLLIDCPLDRDAYIEILRGQGLIPAVAAPTPASAAPAGRSAQQKGRPRRRRRS